MSNKNVTARTFNLIKPVEPPKSYWDKVYEWVVSRAKVIFIVCEVLIVTAFALKVVVDNSANSRKEVFQELKNQSAFYEAQYEQEIRRTQSKSFEYLKLWNGSSQMAEILQEVYGYLPASSNEITVKIDKDRLQIYGTDDLEALRILEQSLKNSSTFTTAAVDTLSLEQQDSLEGRGRYVLTAIISENNLTRSDLEL